MKAVFKSVCSDRRGRPKRLSAINRTGQLVIRSFLKTSHHLPERPACIWKISMFGQKQGVRELIEKCFNTPNPRSDWEHRDQWFFLYDPNFDARTLGNSIRDLSSESLENWMASIQ